MPAAGLEPARCCHQQILSLPRLPIPTSRRPKNSILNRLTIFNINMENNHFIKVKHTSSEKYLLQLATYMFHSSSKKNYIGVLSFLVFLGSFCFQLIYVSMPQDLLPTKYCPIVGVPLTQEQVHWDVLPLIPPPHTLMANASISIPIPAPLTLIRQRYCRR